MPDLLLTLLSLKSGRTKLATIDAERNEVLSGYTGSRICHTVLATRHQRAHPRHIIVNPMPLLICEYWRGRDEVTIHLLIPSTPFSLFLSQAEGSLHSTHGRLTSTILCTIFFVVVSHLLLALFVDTGELYHT